MTDLYEELGVERDASEDDIKAAARRVARETHPDRPDGGDPERFARSRHALTVLKDPEARAHYDRTGSDGGGRSKLEDPVAIIIAQAFEMSLLGLADDDPGYFDLPDKMRDWIGEQIAKGEKANAGIEESQGKLEALAERLSFKGAGRDIVGEGVQSKLRINRESLEANTLKLAEHREALAMMDSWEYRLDDLPDLGPGIFSGAPVWADIASAAGFQMQEQIRGLKESIISEALRGKPKDFPDVSVGTRGPSVRFDFGSEKRGGERPSIPRYDTPRGKK